MVILRSLLFYVLIFSCLGVTAHAQGEEHHNEKPFGLWLTELRKDAASQGISDRTIDSALTDIEPLPEVVRLDRKQPESKLTLEEYLERVVAPTRIEKAKELFSKHKALLEEISGRYGVEPQFIVALWGIESNFGERMGSFGIIEALATLAYDGRRSEFFRSELIKALKIIDNGDVEAYDMVGSWAGAMGQCQFMPSSYLSMAVDYNDDGKRDIWGTHSDVFASIANYLSTNGWQTGAGYKEDEHNYKVLLKWNRSRYFATAVGMLADHIAQGE